MTYGAKQYKQTSIQTASRGQVLIMLYEAAIRHLKKAAIAIDKNDLNVKAVAIGKTHDILNELSSSLDHKVGGKLAEDLERLYQFCVDQIIKANYENTRKPLDDAAKILENLLAGWKSAVKEVESK
jgi:flagellar protein FliS